MAPGRGTSQVMPMQARGALRRARGARLSGAGQCPPEASSLRFSPRVSRPSAQARAGLVPARLSAYHSLQSWRANPCGLVQGHSFRMAPESF